MTDKQTTQSTERNIKKFYHYTSFKHEESIKQFGLIPQSRNISWLDEEPRVWLSDDREHVCGDIIYCIELDTVEEGEKLVATGEVSNGRGGYPEYVYYGTIPYEKLREIYRRKEDDFSPKENLMIKSLKRLFFLVSIKKR